jgi:hypothetical protein
LDKRTILSTIGGVNMPINSLIFIHRTKINLLNAEQWYCSGEYETALQYLLSAQKNFEMAVKMIKQELAIKQKTLKGSCADCC